MRNKCIKAIKQNNLYDFIANHYWEMDRADLKDIILELDYQLYSMNINDDVILDELNSRWDKEDEIDEDIESEIETYYKGKENEDVRLHKITE